MIDHIRRGACTATGKRIYITRADAKQNMRRSHLKDLAVYKCGDCGYFHQGGWHGSKDRAVHRGENPPDTISIAEASGILGVSITFIHRLIDTGKIRTFGGDPIRADIERLTTI